MCSAVWAFSNSGIYKKHLSTIICYNNIKSFGKWSGEQKERYFWRRRDASEDCRGRQWSFLLITFSDLFSPAACFFCKLHNSIQNCLPYDNSLLSHMSLPWPRDTSDPRCRGDLVLSSTLLGRERSALQQGRQWRCEVCLTVVSNV